MGLFVGAETRVMMQWWRLVQFCWQNLIELGLNSKCSVSALHLIVNEATKKNYERDCCRWFELNNASTMWHVQFLLICLWYKGILCIDLFRVLHLTERPTTVTLSKFTRYLYLTSIWHYSVPSILPPPSLDVNSLSVETGNATVPSNKLQTLSPS